MSLNDAAIDFIGLAVVKDYADFIFTLSQENLSDMGIDDRGFLRGSGDVKLNVKDVVIEYTAEYADAVNSGTDPHPVSDEGIEQIRGWVDRKLGVPTKDIDKVTMAIVWKIRKLGQEPKPFFDKALADAEVMYKGKLDLR